MGYSKLFPVNPPYDLENVDTQRALEETKKNIVKASNNISHIQVLVI